MSNPLYTKTENYFKKRHLHSIYMKMGKSDIEHQADVVLNITNILAARFFKFAKTLTDKDDMEYLTELAKSIGYLTGVNTNVHKTFKHEKRLKAIEDKLKLNMAIPMKMFEEPQLEQYR